MRKNHYFVIGMLTALIVSCSTNLDDVEARLDQLEKNASKEEPKEAPPEVSIKKISFVAKDNPAELIQDVIGDIQDDNNIECWAAHIMHSKDLSPVIEYEGQQLYINDEHYVVNKKYDFSKPVLLTVQSDTVSKKYVVNMHAFTGLPILTIETEDHQEINSKSDYVKAHFTLTEDVVTRSVGSYMEMDGQIKGRGNWTWGERKKPYRIKFDEKQSLLDEPKNKSWVLLANLVDKSLMRNQIAFELSKMSNLEYTPSSHFVEVILNNKYWGNYQLCDKLKIGKHRVNVGDDGFFLEVDHRLWRDPDARLFDVPHIEYAVDVKDPDVEYNDSNYNYIKNVFEVADAALFSDNYADETNGWRKYIDETSLVDWYLINEIAKNNDAQFLGSCFFNVERGGKIKFGPVWDFDIAFGNWDRYGMDTPDGFVVRRTQWMTRFYSDPLFVKRLKERFDYFYSKRYDIAQLINVYSNYLSKSAIENDCKWGIFYFYEEHNFLLGNYQNECQWFKEWLFDRFQWLKKEMDKM